MLVEAELRNIISHKLWKTLKDKKVIKGMLKVRGCLFLSWMIIYKILEWFIALDNGWLTFY